MNDEDIARTACRAVSTVVVMKKVGCGGEMRKKEESWHSW